MWYIVSRCKKISHLSQRRSQSLYITSSTYQFVETFCSKSRQVARVWWYAADVVRLEKHWKLLKYANMHYSEWSMISWSAKYASCKDKIRSSWRKGFSIPCKTCVIVWLSSAYRHVVSNTHLVSFCFYSCIDVLQLSHFWFNPTRLQLGTPLFSSGIERRLSPLQAMSVAYRVIKPAS